MVKANKDNSTEERVDSTVGISKISKKTKINKVYVLVPALLLLVIGATLFVYLNSNKESNVVIEEENEYSFAELINSDSEEDKTKLVETYGEDYQAAVDRSFSSDFKGWDDQKVNDAYIALLYADKVDDFNQVYTSLSMLKLMQSGGVDIDNNLYGVNQEMRDAIKARADKSSGAVLNEVGVPN